MSEEAVNEEVEIENEMVEESESDNLELVEDNEVEESEDSGEEVQSETVEEFKQEVEEAIEDGATEEEVRSMIAKFDLKVNGKIVEKEIDLSDRDAIQRELQKAAAFNQTAQEAAQLKKMYEQEIQRLQSNPWDVLKELGLDPEELNERFLDERIEEMKKTPEQKADEAMKKELAEARQRLKEIEEKEQSAEEQRKIEAAEASLSEEITEALSAHATLPPTQKTVSRIADALLHAMDFAEENGYDANAISVADVIPYVEDEYRKEMRNLLDNAPEQMLEEYVGKQNIERLRKNKVANFKNNPKQVVKETANSVKKESKPKEKVSMSDYFRDLQRVK